MDRRLLEKADYLLSLERGTVFKDPGGKINIALVYPNRYSVGMSSLGFQGVYRLLNSRPDVVCERAFLPAEDDLKLHRRTRTGVFTLESKRPLSRFDIIAFSVSFENDYPNLLEILALSGIPLRSEDRGPRDPLVIMGGVCAFYNPEPLAEFMDICFIGEAEDMLPEFLEYYGRGPSRDKLFSECFGIEGVYVPRYYAVDYRGDDLQITSRSVIGSAPAVIRKRTVTDISCCVIRPMITTPEAEFSDMYLAEAMRGCPWSCRFCVAGHIYKPPRKKDLNALKAEVADALRTTRKVGLIGPSLSDYQHAGEILSVEGVDFSITSLRASPRSAQLVSLMKGHKSVSIAPEAGTERLRRVINKKISEKDILETAGLILGAGIGTLRLYFMIGLPTETREDVSGIVDLVRKIREANKRGFINLTVSTFVPKPFTPFQWHPMEKMSEVKERRRIIRKGLSDVRGVKVHHDVLKDAYIQGMLSVGDRRSSVVIRALAGTEGVSAPGPGQDYYIFRKKDREENLPWDFIDAGITKEMVWEEYCRALADSEKPADYS
ncbi:MAG: radical SAM protein [Nitrospiraceae bacterium]|nr:radical SAM protein [Nitrospiraceae bacterium]